MSSSVVLDNVALAALAERASEAKNVVRAAMTAALRMRREVVVPAVVLAEMYRGHHHNQVVDAHVVAAAVESGGGICLTGDPDDLSALAAPYAPVQIVDVNRTA